VDSSGVLISIAAPVGIRSKQISDKEHFHVYVEQVVRNGNTRCSEPLWFRQGDPTLIGLLPWAYQHTDMTAENMQNGNASFISVT